MICSLTNWSGQKKLSSGSLLIFFFKILSFFDLSDNFHFHQLFIKPRFLAHLSRRLIGELIVYPWSGVRRRPSVVRPSVVRRPSFTMLKHLLLRNRWANQSQILCGASLGWGNESLFAGSWSHDQDGRHAHIWSKPFKNLLLQNRRADFHETWYVASGTPAHHSLFK